MCEFCESDKDVLYQTNIYTNLYISNFENRKTIKTVSTHRIPPITEGKKSTHKVAFIINFCPECGRDLRNKMRGEENNA